MRTVLFAVLCVALGAVPAAPALAADCKTPMLEFEIEDQFQEKHTHAEFAGTPTVLVWSDRESRKFVQAWEDTLRADLADRIADGSLHFRSVAHVKGVPFFVKGKVRGKFSQQPDQWALLDWGGEFREAYAPRENQVAVFVFDASGCLVDMLSGVELGEVERQVLVEEIRGL